jgi:hypothetical protein
MSKSRERLSRKRSRLFVDFGRFRRPRPALFRNQQVVCSSHITSSTRKPLNIKGLRVFLFPLPQALPILVPPDVPPNIKKRQPRIAPRLSLC